MASMSFPNYACLPEDAEDTSNKEKNTMVKTRMVHAHFMDDYIEEREKKNNLEKT